MPNEPKPVVLVADDEPQTLALVAQRLRSVGYEVLEASDGEQAWATAKDRLPDLVVLDVMMPGMSGWEVCRKVREDVALAHTAVVMLTGIGQNLNEMTSPLFGADRYVDKPFEFAALDRAVREALDERAAQRAIGRKASSAARPSARPSRPADRRRAPRTSRKPAPAKKTRKARGRAAKKRPKR